MKCSCNCFKIQKSSRAIPFEFIMYSSEQFPMSSFQSFVLLNALMTHQSLGKIAKRMPTVPKLEQNYHINLKLFVCLLDLGFKPTTTTMSNLKLFFSLLELQFRPRFLCALCMFGLVWFRFGQNGKTLSVTTVQKFKSDLKWALTPL